MITTQVAPTPISKEQAQASYDFIAGEFAECGYPVYICEDLRVSMIGPLTDEPTYNYATHSCTRTFKKLIADHEMIIDHMKTALDSLNRKREQRGCGPVSSGQIFDAHKIWTEELTHIILLRDYFLQRLEQHKSNE